MSYQGQAQLEADFWWQQRNRSVAIQQAETFKDDQRPDWQATAQSILRDDPGFALTFSRIAAGGPGIADKADNGDGTIDQSKVTDADLLSLTQANWSVVAGLYFAEDGTPL
jgi:hypothetical protein